MILPLIPASGVHQRAMYVFLSFCSEMQHQECSKKQQGIHMTKNTGCHEESRDDQLVLEETMGGAV